MVWIEYKASEFISEGRLGLRERNSMLRNVRCLFFGIPFEYKMSHAVYCNYIVIIVKGGTVLASTDNALVNGLGVSQVLY